MIVRGSLKGTGYMLAAVAALLAALGAVGVAEAAQPQPWEMTLQPPATDVAARVVWFEGYTLWIVTGIVLFVLALLLWCIVRFNHKANPTASKTSHNTIIEVVWTAVPVLILVAIAIPSFRLLFYETTIPDSDITIKATGHQWYWSYDYPNEGMENISYASYMLNDSQLAEYREKWGFSEAQAPRLLAVDYQMVVPVGENVRLQVTSGDVNHSYAMPSFGVKKDAIPGRLNETWFRVERPGQYFGQCSELCGSQHAFMPISVIALEEDRWEEWVKAANEDVNKANDMLLGWQSAPQDADTPTPTAGADQDGATKTAAAD